MGPTSNPVEMFHQFEIKKLGGGDNKNNKGKGDLTMGSKDMKIVVMSTNFSCL
jgi:hypothetical protein